MDNPGDEILSVVDEDDKEVGRDTLHAIHSKGLLHREAHIYIIKEKKLVLLQKRSDNGLWDTSSAGHFSPEEDYLQGAMRESHEELGISLPETEFRFLAKVRMKKSSTYTDSQGRTHPKINNIFAGVFLIEKEVLLESFVIDPSEVAGIQYFSRDELVQLLGSEGITSVSKDIIREQILPLMKEKD